MRDRVFRHKDLRDFNQRYVALRLLGGEDTTEEARRIWLRYELEKFPTSMVLTHDGALLYSEATLDDPQAVLSLMRNGERELERYRAEEAALFERDAPVLERADFRLRYGQLEEAERYARVLIARSDSARYRVELGRILHRLGRTEDRGKALAELIERRGAHPARVRWEIDLCLNHLSGRDGFLTDGEPGEVLAEREILAALRGLLEDERFRGRETAVRERISWSHDYLAKRTEGEEQAEHRAAAAKERDLIIQSAHSLAEGPVPLLVLTGALLSDGHQDVDRLLALTEELKRLAEEDRWPGLAEEAILRLAGVAVLLNTESWLTVRQPSLRDAEYEEALKKSKKAVELFPHRGLFITLGTALYRVGDHAEAVDVLNQAILGNEGQGTPQDFFVRAMCHVCLGKSDAAQADYRRARATMDRWSLLQPDATAELQALEAECQALMTLLPDAGRTSDASGVIAVGDAVDDLELRDVLYQRPFRLSALDVDYDQAVRTVLELAEEAGQVDAGTEDPPGARLCSEVGRRFGLLLALDALPETLGALARRVAEARGKPVVLVPWSPLCKESVWLNPRIVDTFSRTGARLVLLAGKYRSDGERESEEDVRRFLSDADSPAYLVVYDSDHAVTDRFGCVDTCEFLVLDPTRILRYHGEFHGRQGEPLLEHALQAIAEGREVEVGTYLDSFG